jgi:hypothetical protein
VHLDLLLPLLHGHLQLELAVLQPEDLVRVRVTVSVSVSVRVRDRDRARVGAVLQPEDLVRLGAEQLTC